MSLISVLSEKPWEPGATDLQAVSDKAVTRRTGLRFRLVVISVLFTLFLVAFLMRSQYPDWQPLAEEIGHPLFNHQVLWINTIYLVLASIFIQWARMSDAVKSPTLLKVTVVLGGLFAVAFVAGQLLLWQQLYQQGHFVSNNPALSFFYLFTGLHAAHVGIGILAWFGVVFAAFKNSVKLKHFVELCAIYWHFLLGLWVALFALLVSKPETYDAIAAFCGLR